MENTTLVTSSHGNTSAPVTPTSAAMVCPACAGPMYPQRGIWACQRCGLPLCVGCEAESYTAEGEND
jgi:ribosomal protein L37AE/L43A